MSDSQGESWGESLWDAQGSKGGTSALCCNIISHHHQVAIHTLWNIRIVVLAKPEHENRISHICTDNVKTGIANTLGERRGNPFLCMFLLFLLLAMSQIKP